MEPSINKMKKTKIVLYCIMWLCATTITCISVCNDDMTTSSRVNGTIVGLFLMIIIFIVTIVLKPFNE